MTKWILLGVLFIFLVLACTPAQQYAACVAACGFVQAGSSYSCEQIDAEEFPAEKKLCLEGKAVADPSCVALCTIPNEETNDG